MVGTEVRFLEKCLCLRDMSNSVAHEESQKICAESWGLNSGEFCVVEAKDVKISSCQKLGRHGRDEKETETIDVAIMRLSIALRGSSFSGMSGADFWRGLAEVERCKN